MRQGRWRRFGCCALFLAAGAVAAPAAAQAAPEGMDAIDHVVVIYQENHSFDNLYGRWEGVRGLHAADRAHTTQVNQAGTPYDCLLQNDVNLTSPPLAATCTEGTTTSHFNNAPFAIDSFIPSSAKTCPAPGVFAPNGVLDPNGLPGGCTRDLVHRYYEEQY